MEVRFKLNGKQVSAEVSGDTILLDVLRNLGCYSVKCGCETTNCGLCTVWINGKSRLSCSILAAGIEGQEVTTLEGLKEEAEEFGASCTGRCRTVWILLSGIHYECAGNGAGVRKSND